MSDTTTARFSRFSLILAAILVAGAVGTKLWQNSGAAATGSDGMNTSAAQPDVGAMISELEARLKANPNDAQGWRMLGWSFLQTQRFAEAATAYRRATAISPENAELWSSLGEALVMAGPGTSFPPDARAAFDKAVALDPKDPRARYFIGVARDMSGDHKGAINDWLALLSDTPPGAPWEASVRQIVQQVGTREKIDVAGRLAAIRPPAPEPGSAGAPIPGPSPDQMRAATALPPGQQEAMVRGMVEGLAAKLKADPKNVEGWIMLMRSYTTLGRSSDAATAYRNAIAANPAAKAQLAEAADQLGIRL